jgi:hypothetical protein
LLQIQQAQDHLWERAFSLFCRFAIQAASIAGWYGYRQLSAAPRTRTLFQTASAQGKTIIRIT